MGEQLLAVDEATTAPDRADALLDRILAATMACIARWGVAKTTLDDVARQAGCSRATLYRVVPGGRDALLLAAADRELRRVEAGVAEDLDRAVDLEDLLATALHRGVAAVRGHAALQYLLEHEPEHVLPWVAFDELDPLLAQVAAFARPWITAHLPASAPPALPDELGEHLARLIVTYALDPEGGPDLTDPTAARLLVRTYVLPSVEAALAADPTDPTPGR